MRSTRMLLIGAMTGVIAAVATLFLVLPAEARPSASMTLSPASTVVRSGQNVTVALTVTTRGARTNAVQADLAFPANVLDCGSVVVESATWGVTAQKTCANGRLTIAVGSFVQRTGTLPVARITFRAKNTGSARVTFVPETAVINSDTENAARMPLTTVGTTVVVRR